MRRLHLAFLSLFLLFIQSLYAQTYTGQLVLKLGGTLEGTISGLNLSGENKGLIYIETSSTAKTKNKREKVTSSTTEKNGYHPAIISRVILNGKTYLFRNLRYGYDDKNIRENCAVERHFGNDSLGIFQWTNPEGKISYYIITPRFTDYAEDISHPKYDGDGFKSFTGMKFYRCKTLGDKIYNRENGYFYNNESFSTEQKLDVWKRILQEYMACF